MNSESKNLTLGEPELLSKVAVAMGSDSDLPTLEPAIKILEEFSIEVEARVLSAHRTPIEMMKFACEAKSKGFKVIIAGAGGAAHLPGMLASMTPLPVIGVPVQTKSLSGIDSMHSILQMPGGIPVATVAIGGGLNAGLLAAQILGTYDQKIQDMVERYRKKIHGQVINKDIKLKNIGSTEYLNQMHKNLS